MHLVTAELLLILAVTSWAVASGHRASRRFTAAARRFEVVAKTAESERLDALLRAESHRLRLAAEARDHAARVAERLRSTDPDVASIGA